MDAIKELKLLSKLSISRDSLAEETVKSYSDFAKENSVELEWITDEDSQILVDKWK